MEEIIKIVDDCLVIDWQKMEINKQYPFKWLGSKCRVVRWPNGKIEIYQIGKYEKK